jgi:hypothetical protein
MLMRNESKACGGMSRVVAVMSSSVGGGLQQLALGGQVGLDIVKKRYVKYLS